MGGERSGQGQPVFLHATDELRIISRKGAKVLRVRTNKFEAQNSKSETNSNVQTIQIQN